jgi:D-glycero-D-manno-heptose 1,7-bisphosphate phosphatase
MGRPALFLDRDGTLVEPYHYPSHPEHLRLYPTVGPELRRLQQAGFCLVVVTNQAGLARGYFSDADLQRLHVHLVGALARWGVRLDAIYHCPHHPDGAVPALAVRCACRKPRPGMLLQAAADLDVDLRRSWLVGDILDDVEAGARAGCQTVLVDLTTEQRPAHPLRWPAYVARDSAHALRIVRAVEGCGPPVELTYVPSAWCAPDGPSRPERQIASPGPRIGLGAPARTGARAMRAPVAPPCRPGVWLAGPVVGASGGDGHA